MNRILNNVQQNLLSWIFGVVVFGLLNVRFFGGISFSSLICLLAAFIMIYPSLVPLDFEKLKYLHKNSNTIMISLFLNFVMSPLLALFLGYVFLRNYPALWVGIMLISLLPGGGMATTWALKSKADMPTVVGIIFSNLIVAIFVVPVVLSIILNKFMQAQVMVGSNSFEIGSCSVSKATNGMLSCLSFGSISPLKIAMPILFIVVIPLFLAYVTQKVIIAQKGNDYFENLKPLFSKFSNLGMMVMLLILMSLKSNEVVFSHPEMILVSILPLAFFYLTQFVIIMWIYNEFHKDEKG